MKKESFQRLKKLLKDQFGIVTTVLSLLVLMVSAIQSLTENYRTGALVLLSIFTLILFIANYWIFTTRKSSMIEPRIHSKRYTSGFRFGAIFLSIILLAGSWTVALLPLSPKYYGSFLYKTGRCESAITQFELYHEADKGTLETYLSLADCYKKSNDYLNYVATLETALSKESFFNNNNVLKGNIHSDVGNSLIIDQYEIQYINQNNKLPEKLYERASRHLNLAQLYRGEDVIDYWMLGFSRAAHVKKSDNIEHETKAVLTIFDKALKLLSGGILTTQLLEDKLSVLSDALSDTPKELGSYRDVLAEHHYWLGRAYLEMNNLAAAKNAFQIGLNLLSSRSRNEEKFRVNKFYIKLATVEVFQSAQQPDEINTVNLDKYVKKINDPSLLADAYVSIGLKAFIEAVSLQNKDGFQAKKAIAEKFLVQAFRLGTKQYKATLLLGTLYRMDNNYPKAVTQYELAIAAKPGDPVAYEAMVRTYVSANNRLEAMRYARSWAEVAPNDSDAHYWYSMLVVEDDIDIAITAIEQSIKLNPDNPDYQYVLGSTLNHKRNQLREEDKIRFGEQALDALNQSIRLSENSTHFRFKQNAESTRTELWNSLAYDYANQRKNLLLAEKYINSALETIPDEPHMLDTKAWVLLMQAEAQQNEKTANSTLLTVEKLLSKSLKLLSTKDTQAKAEVYFHLGYLEQMRDKPSLAKQAYIKALELNPQYSEAKAELSKLGQ